VVGVADMPVPPGTTRAHPVPLQMEPVAGKRLAAIR
jgi:hypothetical protein